jgi:hypothetical protein
MFVSIVDVVDEYLVKKALNNDRDNNHFHASSWNKCHRKAAYLYYCAKEYIKVDTAAVKIDPKLERIFDNGHYMHARWGSYLENCCEWLRGRWECSRCGTIHGEDEPLGCLRPEKCLSCFNTAGVEKGVRVYKEVGFYEEETLWGGHVDAILDFRIIKPELYNGRTDADCCIIVDFKTMYDYGFKQLKEPTEDHMIQMQIYLCLSGLNEGRFLYEDKDNQKVKEYVVKRDDELIKKERQKAIDLKYLVTHTNSAGNHVLPPRKYPSKSSVECKRCEFRGDCWK